MKLQASYLAAVCMATACSTGPRSSESVAKVNKVYIPISTFDTQAKRLASVPGIDLSNPKRRRALLTDIIRQELLFQAAMKDGLPNRSDRLKREIAMEYLTDRIGKIQAQPTEAEIRNFYESQKDELDQVHASHILISPENKSDPKSWERAKLKANSILKQIRAEGEKADFAKYARLYSSDKANKDQGGDLGEFNRKRMVPEFSEAAFSLRPGQISDPVRTAFGYHIIKLISDKRGFEFHKSAIQWKIVSDRRKAAADKLLSELQSAAKIKIYDDVLAKAKAGNVSDLPK